VSRSHARSLFVDRATKLAHMHQPAKVALQNLRRPLVGGGLLVAEELVARPELPPRGETAGRGLAITFAGAFEFQVGKCVSWIDPSRLLFIEAGLPYVDHHVVPGVGHSSVILRADAAALEELWEDVDAQFAGRVGACSLRVQMLAQLLRRAAEPLAAQELGVAILEESVADRRPVTMIDQRCVRRAKSLLHDCPEGRLSLSQIAADLGVTPIYLTQSFKRSEGMPLYRYQTLLRLGRALDRLPGCEDITDLAFELGYSSHSHFTAVFRSELGMTPSQYRSVARQRTVGWQCRPMLLAS
jgi:AraC family transcriptional regulator